MPLLAASLWGGERCLCLWVRRDLLRNNLWGGCLPSPPFFGFFLVLSLNASADLPFLFALMPAPGLKKKQNKTPKYISLS